MTLEDFKTHILADEQRKYTEAQIKVLFEMATRFSDFAFKKWGDEMHTIVSKSDIITI